MISDEKKALRTAVRRALRQINPKDRAVWSAAITERALTEPQVLQAESIFLYWGMDTEVDTRALMDGLCALGKKVYLPKVVGDGLMVPVRYWTGCPMSPGAYGIMEPENDETCERIDLILSPGVAFDKECARLGQGGGFYDRFLEKSGAKVIALAFEMQMVDCVPRDVHDKSVDMVITEKTAYAKGKEQEKC